SGRALAWEVGQERRGTKAVSDSLTRQAVDGRPMVATDASVTLEAAAWLALFRRGFLGLLPLWLGAIPIGIAYGVAARAAGFSLFETQLMSVIVFSASAQVSALALLGAGAPALIIVLTALALNSQLVVIGLAVGRQERPS